MNDEKPSKATTALLVIALIVVLLVVLALCAHIGFYFPHPELRTILSMTEQEICGSYTLDFLAGISLCALMFILVAYVFGRLNKRLLAIIVIPAAILGFYLFIWAINDDSISSYGYLARHCVLQQITR